MSNLLHLKASRTQILNTFPAKTFGKDGDIVLAKIKGKGVYLCSKADGTWYTANKLEELRKTGQISTNKISTNKLSINRLSNATINNDRFLVSDSDSIAYRTSEQVIDDLDISVKDIDYKTAYCSLGQYKDKNSCEDGGGTWYYSENDSHDSISSTAENQLLTVGQSIGNVDAEPTLLYDGSTIEIKRNTNYDDNWQTSAQTNLLKLTYDSSNSAIFDVDSSGNLTLDSAGLVKLDAEDFAAGEGVQFLLNGTQVGNITGHHSATYLTLYENVGASTNDSFNIACGANGVTSISTVDAAAAAGHLTLVPDGDLILDPFSNKIIINATDKLYFDGSGDTYIQEISADSMVFRIGNDYLFTLSEYGADGNEALFKDSCATFTRREALFSATGVIASGGSDDTDIDFRFSNKYRLEMTADIQTVNLVFPIGSGNFTLVCTTNGDHDVSAWKVWEYDETAATTADVMWAGGSVPAFTSSGVDIVSFYWDATDQQCYGVASLAFATP